MTPRSPLLWAGVAGPILLNAVFTIEGALRPGYDPVHDFVSELSLGRRGWIQKANFLGAGGLLLLFAWAVLRAFEDQRLAKRAALFVGLIGTGLVGAGTFDTDPFPLTGFTTTGALHFGFAIVTFLSMPALCLTLRNCGSLGRASLVTGWVVLVLLVLGGGIFPFPGRPANALTNYNGAVQRLTQGIFFAWLVTVAIHLRRSPRGRRALP